MKAIGIGLWALPLVLICYFLGQDEFPILFIGITLSFIGYLLINSRFDLTRREIITSALLVRLALLPSFPMLSDDIYRYLWDGLTWWNGLDAYSQTPNQIAQVVQRPDLLSNMNSPDYHAIYPSIVQALFAILAKLGGGNVMVFSILLKLSLLLFECCIGYLLIQLGQILRTGQNAFAWYLLNPLVIVETAGNAHFEVLMLFFTLLAVNFLLKNKHWMSGMALAGGILSKFLPLLLIPAFIFRNAKQAWKFILGLCALLMIGLLPIVMVIGSAAGLADSLGLFVRTFEFNPSIYALLRYFGTLILGYNPIQWVGPALSAVAGTIILVMAWRFHNADLGQWIALISAAFVIQLFCATTVHPWYIILPLGLSLLSGQTYIMVWSYLVFLSYSFYADVPSDILIALEYILLLAYMIVKKESPLHLRATGF